MKKSFSSYFSKLRKSETLKGARPSQLRLETLEDRQLLSVTDLATVAAANETVEYSTVVASSDAVIDVNSVLNTTATNINNDELVALNSAFQAAFTGQESYFTWNSEGHLTSIDLSNYGVPLSPNPDTVDISGFPALQSVNISGWAGKNGHSKLNLTINESTLTYLNCSNNGLTELDLSNCANLETLLCNDNALTSLDLSAQSKLFTLDCSNNQLTDIEFADNNGVNTALYAATVYGNKFETLDFVKCSGLRQLNVYNAELTDVYLDHSATVAVQLYASGFDAATATDSTGASLDVSAASGYYAFSLGSSVADAVVVDLTSGGEVAKTVKFNQFVALNPTSGSVYAVVDENVDLADITVNSSADERFGVAGYAFVVYNDGELVDNPNSYFEISGSTLKYIGGLASSESVYVVSVGAVGNNGKSLGVADFELTVAQAQLATPSLTDATVSYDTASIIWDAVDYATAYVVSYSYEAATDDPMGGFLGDDTTVVSGTETVTETEFNLGDLDVATTVSFSVVAIRDDMIDSEAATIDVTTLDYPTLTTPTNLSYTATTDTITVTWDAVEGAELYAVLLGDIQDTTSETSYTFTGLDVNTAYDFSVQATGEGAYASEAATLEVQTEDYAQLAAPTNLAYTATTDSITVTWDAVEGAELYAVLLGDIQDTTSETSYTFTGLDVNTAYDFSVQATGENVYASQPASLDVATEDYATLATPENLAYTATTDSITLTWDAVEGATGYTVNFDLGGEYTTTETTLTISELAANTSHVVSVIATGENVYASQPASLDVATEDYATLATPENLAYTATTDSITLTWDAVEGATGYTIYFDAGGEYTTTDTTYTIGNLSVNSEYSVAVVATGENVYASQPAALTASTEDYAQLATPTNLAYTATTDSITVTWDAVEGAELYTVCLGDIQDTIAETSYTFTGLEAGTAYEFEVQATADGAYASEAATLIVETEAEPIVEQGIALEDVVNKVYEEDADVAIATIIATNLDNPEVAVTLDGEATDAITIVDGQLVYVGGLELGDYAIVVTATEGEGVFTAEMTLTVAEMTATISLNTYNPIAGQRVVAVIAPNTRANFQWYVGSDEDGWTAIEGANVSYFSAPMGYVGQCLKVEATYVGGKFDGQTLSDQTEVVGRELLNVRILGTENLAVGKKVRTQTVAWNATVDYQWYRVDAEGNETAIEGANASTYVAQVADRFCSLKVVATGNGLWGGEATATTVETVAFSPLSLSITEPVLGDKIFAVMDPADSMTTYQWYVGSEEDGWTEAGASVSSFSVSTACVGKYVKVEATYQRGECAGETYSVVSDAPVSQALTKVNFGKYVPYVGGSVGVYVNPVAANPSYQWYRVEADGDVLIEGATEADYVPTEADVDCYLKVVATSEGIYFGTVEGTTYAPVAAENPVTLSTYDPMLGDTIVATLNPEDATATYQWQYRSEEGRWTAISDATDGYIEPSEEYLGCYLRVIAKYNDGDYAGLSVIGETNSPLAIALDGVEISGDVEIGATLTAVTTPADATAEYQWYRVDAEGVETAIEGATDASYTIAVADRFCYLKVVATGTGAYVGEVEMTVAEAVPFDPISFSTDTPACGHRVSAIMNPVDTFATYQWYVGSEDAGWTAIEGATYSYYSAPVGFIGQYLKVEATYQRGDCESETYSAVTANPLTAGVSQVVLSSTDAYVGVRLGSYTRPVKATVDLQWYRVDGDVETAIDGATDYRYTPTADDIGYVLKLVATGTGSYGGEAFVVTNPVVDPNETPEEVLVAEQDVLATSSSSAITLSNTEPTWGRRVIAALNPSDQFATYQWYAGSDEAGWTAIEGATYSYFSPNVNYVGQCLKVEATTSAGDVVEAQTSKVNFDVTGVAIDEGDQVMVGAAVSAQIVSRRATAEYQWYLVDAEGNETAIEGATDASYTPVMADVDCFLKVVATGLDEFDSTGTYEATTTQAVEFVPVILSTNDPVLGGKIVAKATVDPAFAKFQWSYGSDEAGWTVIEKTRVAYCTPSYAQVGSQMKVTVSYNTGELAGQTFEAVTENIVTRQLTEVALRSDLAFVGNTITVYAKPIGATADYQWYRVDAEGVETEIEGAVEASYVPTDEDAGSTLKVVATGTGAYVGTAEVSTSEIAALDAAFDEIDELDLDLIAKSLV